VLGEATILQVHEQLNLVNALFYAPRVHSPTKTSFPVGKMGLRTNSELSVVVMVTMFDHDVEDGCTHSFSVSMQISG
jgi:hypothetical protein